ncbi:MAG: response regulator, partial [Clostridiales bacterium]|nr:response regulator [Clostridiales bacterium]
MGGRILVIEDNLINLELITYLLKSFSYTVLSATNGDEGIDLAHSQRVDLIICDVHLPGMDGYQVARRLKEHPVLRNIPLVAVTALAMMGDREKALAAGFNSYISKPIIPENFIKQIEE